FGGTRQIAARAAEINRVADSALGGSEVAGLAEDDAVTLLHLANALGVLRLFGNRQRPIARLASFGEFLSRDPEDGEVHLEEDADADVADLLAEGDRLLVRALGRLPAFHARVEHAEVVQRYADVLREAERAVVGQTCLIVPERLFEFAANVRDDAKVL